MTAALDKCNRLTLDELLSKKPREVGSGSRQLELSDNSIRRGWGCQVCVCARVCLNCVCVVCVCVCVCLRGALVWGIRRWVVIVAKARFEGGSNQPVEEVE